MKKFVLLFSVLIILLGVNAQMLNFSLEPDILRISRLNYGQPIELVARVSGVKLSEARDISLVMKIAETDQIKYFTKVSHDTFVLNTRMPEDRRLKKVFLTFELRANIGVDVLVTKTRSIKLTDELLVTLIEPSSGSAILSSPVETIKAKISYINTAPFDRDRLFAKLIVDGKETPITLSKEGNLYVAELQEPIPVGEHKIILKLFGNFSGGDSTETKPSVVMNILILIAVAIVALLMLRWFISYMQKAAERKARKEAEEEEELEEEVQPEEKASELEEVRIEMPTPEKLPKTEEKQRIEEFIVERPKKVEEIPIGEQEREQPIVAGEQPEPKYEIVVPKKPAYKAPEVKPSEQQEEKKEEKKKKRGLIPFMLPKKDEE